MTIKLFLSLATACILFLSGSAVFANTNSISEGMSNVGNEVQSSWDKLGNSVQNAGNHIANGMSNMGMTATNDNQRNNDYTAIRTATNTPTILGMNGTMWTWFVFAILSVVVIALVWYYGMQQKDDVGRHEQ